MEQQTSISDLSELEKNSINHFVNVGRNSLDLQEHHKYLISFAWVTPQDREKFILFPEVIAVDSLVGTNNENRPLLMMDGNDSNGKMFIF